MVAGTRACCKKILIFQRDRIGRLIRNNSGHPLCTYCLTASHPRVSCKFRQHDLNVGHDVHPQRESPSYEILKDGPEIKRDRVVKQHPTDLPSRGRSDNTPSNDATFATEFRTLSDHSQISKEKENLPGEFQSPRDRRISNKDVLEIIQFLDNDSKNIPETQCNREGTKTSQS